jgi:hypothetical protein
MKLYALDAIETDKPWERWEQSSGTYRDSTWLPCSGHPTWHKKFIFKRKPKTININGFEVPEPVREPLEYPQEFYLVSTTTENLGSMRWGNHNEQQYRWLKQGLIHLTKENAELHAKALLSFTQKDK